jgi:NADPH:quinone reductase-like Zn-dependent oxidoreductase
MGIPSDHIFSSRTTDFEHKIMELTDGYGIDIILNSVVGEMLEASWNIIAHGGTLIEIGKKDIGDHNRLSMEPFKRCASYRAMDIPEFRRSRVLISRWVGPEVVSKYYTDLITMLTLYRLFKQLFDMFEQGHIKPIFPLQVFPFDNIQEALLLLRNWKKHIGKLVISRNAKEHIKVPVSDGHLPQQGSA